MGSRTPPFLARSHMIPMLETARIAVGRGARATFVTTPANAHLIQPTVLRGGASMSLLLTAFPFAEFSLPEGCENITVLPLSLVGNSFGSVFALRDPLDDLLLELRPDAIVSDALFPWTTALAAEHGVPRLIFQVTGLFPLCAANDIDLHRSHEAVSGRAEPFTVAGFPHDVRFTRAELPEVFDFPYILGLLHEAELTSYGVIVNTQQLLRPRARLRRALLECGPQEGLPRRTGQHRRPVGGAAGRRATTRVSRLAGREAGWLGGVRELRDAEPLQ